MGMDMYEEIGSLIAGIYAIVAGVGLLTTAFGIAMWILQSLGMYTIAQRRQIKHPWMAWLPVTNMWILGSISDQYYYVARGKVKNRRKWLIALTIAAALMGFATVVVQVITSVQIVMGLNNGSVDPSSDPMQMVTMMLPQLGFAFLVWAVAVWSTVIQHMSYYGLYSSCDPNNKAVLTVLGIFFPVTVPFFVFACRNKDRGMPPRKDAAPAQPAAPVEIPAPVKAEAEEDPINVNNVEE